MIARAGREPLYDKFADAFLEHARDGFYNALYDRPACLELLGNVQGKQVLDAACGPGLYAAELSSRGAQVWNKGWEVAYWLMPLEVICDEIFRAGFRH